jgi:hypothetical protein
MRSDIQFISAGIWSYITAAIHNTAHHSAVAVAYFGDGASRILPLKRGSTLVVDASKSAVQAGQTKPSELIKLIRQGVRVYTVGNLHAKVFVLGDRVVVGSNNASRSSANGLIEAAIVTRARSAVAACRAFVESLTGEPITVKYAQVLQKLYRPPTFGPVRRRSGKKEGAIAPEHSRFWVVPLLRDATDLEYDEADRGTPNATSKMKKPKESVLDWFAWSGPKSASQAKIGDLAFCITNDARRKFGDEPSRIVDMRSHPKGAIIYLERREGVRRKSLDTIVQRLGRSAVVLKSKRNIVPLRDALLVHDLMQLWP